MKTKNEQTTTQRQESSANADHITIDYPVEGEAVPRGHYAVRISVHSEGDVQISLTRGSWQPCRPAVGYYWYDWNAVKTGEHALTVRYRREKGQWQTSEARRCIVQ